MTSRQIKLVLIIYLFGISHYSFGKTDKYRCMWTQDPATSMTIAWNQASGKNPVLYFDTYDYGKEVAAYAYRHQPDRVVSAKGMLNIFARLKNLSPSTVYYFVIQDSEGTSQRMSFRTAPDHAYERLSIIAGGDSRNHRKGRRNANKLVGKLRPHCVLFGGDMTGSDKAREWKLWLDDWQHSIGADGRMTPLIVARGNHEYSNESIVNIFDVLHPKVYYALSLGGNLLRIYTLNSLIASGGDQGKWLKKDLKENQHYIWSFAQYHFAIRPHTKRKREQNGQYKNWALPFHQYGVDLVVESDAHVVKTTWPIRPTNENGSELGFIRDDSNGTVYIGEGCWGAPLRSNDDEKKWTRNSGSFNQFKWIFVSDNAIEVRTIETNNADEVGSVDAYDIFSPPSNLKIWSPSNGAVLRIEKKYAEAFNGNGSYSAESFYSTLHPTTASTVPTSKSTYDDSATPSKPLPKEKTIPQLRSPSHSSTAVIAATKQPFQRVEVSELIVKRQNDKIAIEWKVAKESEAIYTFEVQRSLQGEAFKTFAKVRGVGVNGSGKNAYKIFDASDGHDTDDTTLNYRIKAIAPDGKISFYTAKQEQQLKEKASQEKWSHLPLLHPDTKNDILKVRYELVNSSDIEISMIDESAQIFYHTQYSDQKAGNYQKSIDLKKLPKGLYLLRVNINQQTVKEYRVMK